MCHVGVCIEVRSSFIVIRLSNDCKLVFNEASLTLWCHVVVRFEEKMTGFFGLFSGIEGLPRDVGSTTICVFHPLKLPKWTLRPPHQCPLGCGKVQA